MGGAKRHGFVPTLTGTAVMAFFLCLALTAGALAVFLDKVSNGPNRIQTGSLSSAFWGSQTLSSDGTLSNRFDLTDPANKLFEGVAWYPGTQCVRYLQVENTGTLPLSYTIVFSSLDHKLGEHLTFAIRPLNGCLGSPSSGSNKTVAGNQIDSITIENPFLPPDTTSKEIFEITCRMDEWDAFYGRTSPDLFFSLDITLLVTQTEITQPGGAVLCARWEDLLSVAPFGTVLLTQDIYAPQEALTLDRPVNFDLNGHTLTVRSLRMTDSSRKGLVGFRNGSIIATGRTPDSDYGIVVDAPQVQVHFSGFSGTVYANGLVFEDGVPQIEPDPPSLADGITGS